MTREFPGALASPKAGKNTDKNLSEVAEESGFKSLSAFLHSFKKTLWNGSESLPQNISLKRNWGVHLGSVLC